ncbi:hypothetical protein ACFOZ7_06415 [Natribaculum luteum]|uniref:DUF7313 domain-containing protein n=1 Tax=Natribaculum luteum TaxID=1586232 RepID=A0ABD5NX41_9EURY|nr:hypothetical protein [Natribaculum luteum]
MITASLLGPVDILAQEVVSGVAIIEFVLLGLVIINLAARMIAHRGYVNAAREDGADGVSRSLFLEATDVLIVLGGFYYATVHLHGGVVFATLAVGMFITDFFEFEARLVEARKDAPLERPKAALFASALVFLYIAYQSLFFIIKPLWDAVI